MLNILSNINNSIFIFTKPNNDFGHQYIINKINVFCKTKNNCYFFDSLGQKVYYSLIKYSDVLIGNSSSFFYEAPFFNKKAINFGSRQIGRLKAKNVINCDLRKNSKEIYSIINKILTEKKKYKFSNPYFKRNCTKNTLNIFNKFF